MSVAAGTGDGPRASILVIDDDVSIRSTLVAILEAEGYRVESAASGAEGIEKSRQEFFDLAVIDMRLPDMYGVDILGKLQVRVPKTYKIIQTGYPNLQNAIKAVNEGADGYILKPVDGETLLKEITKHLSKRDEAKSFSEQRIVDFIQTRARQLGLRVSEQGQDQNVQTRQEQQG